MRISVIGAGYVGLVTGLCFSEMGHEVVCIDVVQEKVDMLNRGHSPIFEKDLDDMLRKGLDQGRFRASMHMSSVLSTDISFICVGTPSREDGSIDIGHLRSATEMLGRTLREKDGRHLVVVKSTVVPGTTMNVVVPMLEESSGKVVTDDIGIAMNPEFLKEGVAVDDFKHPDRIVVGAMDERDFAVMEELYSPLASDVLRMDPSTAEMVKIASNAFLATKISFVNEIGNICKGMGIDFRMVAEGMGRDARIGPLFLRAGCGFGGSCFPKDLRSIRAEAGSMGIRTHLLDAVLSVNEGQPLRMIELLERHIDPKGARIAVLGLAFKPGTDDVREAPSLRIVAELLDRGALVSAFDPKAMDNFRRFYPDLTYAGSVEECVRGADAALILTEWSEFASPGLFGEMLVIDGRGITRTGNYEGICW